jgi:preprotein translocase subunit SecF
MNKFHIDFLGKRKLAMTFSLALVIISLASLATRGLTFGIDFTGGTLVEVSYQDTVTIDDVRSDLAIAENLLLILILSARNKPAR